MTIIKGRMATKDGKMPTKYWNMLKSKGENDIFFKYRMT